jgi:UDP-3-O-acyl N-acetylglucosamine deacetylase
LVTVEGGEVPALDGSSLPFVDAICAAGVVEQCADRDVVWLEEAVWVEHGGAQLLALPADRLRITYGISFDHPLLRQQMFSLDIDDKAYRQEIAPARTFGFVKEVQALRDRGLARGGTMENAVVLGDDGYLCPLRFGDEPVRHKILDLIGDLALLGAPLSAHVIGLKTSHSLNIGLVRRILDTRRE